MCNKFIYKRFVDKYIIIILMFLHKYIINCIKINLLNNFIIK